VSIADKVKIADLERRVAVLERQERSYFEAVDKLLERVDALEKSKSTLTLPDKKRA
jgi:predicted  nucleic acid-binding Zn-ribbon protein